MVADNVIVGRIVGGYRVTKVLDDKTGGMGDTYIGEKDGELAVIKTAAAGEDQDEHQRLLFREARLLAPLKHPRLPKVYHFDKGCMVMEYVKGENVKEYVDRLKGASKDFSTREDYLRNVIDWTLQLADVLDCLHSFRPKPIVHRDIKHTNVMVRASGDICLIDFGIARLFDEKKHAAQHKDTLLYGTTGWIAPEHAAYVTTPKSDLYMVGVLIYYWLTGNDPQDFEERKQPLTGLQRREHDGLWNGLVEICENLRQDDWKLRYDARELATELKRLAPPDGGEEVVTEPCSNANCRTEVRISARFCPHCGEQRQRERQEEAEASAPALDVSILFPDDHGRTRDRVVMLAESNTPVALERFGVHQRLRELEQDPGFSELISLDSLAHVERLPHQIDAVKTALNRMRGWCLLADEVGLGKTIEAGIVLKELMQRDLVKRVLVIAPRDLCTQWQQELFDKFNLFFLVFGKDVDYSLAWQCDRVIAPYGVIEDRFHHQELLEQRFDLVIMDEAHHLIVRDDRRDSQSDHRRKMLHDFAKKVDKRYFLMLSATPLHDDLRDLHELLTLLKPGSVGDYASFKERFMDPDDPYSPRNVGELRRRLEEVMIRRQRRLIAGLKFPRRNAHKIKVKLEESQQTVFQGFRDLVTNDLWCLADENRYFRYSLQALVESFHSSPAAFHRECDDFLQRFQTLLADGVQRRLRTFRDKMTPSLLSGKIQQAADILAKAAGETSHKVLVFTQYEDTADLLYQRLADLTGLEIVRYPSHEDADSSGKAIDILTRFEGAAQVMVCTENASEGLNLQMAGCMLNFDLPWDPMKLEQRIGRIQRLGQRRDQVFIYNLFLGGTVEEQILDILERKIDMFGATIGHVEEILGNLADDQSFNQVFLDLYRGDESGANEQIDIMVRKTDETTAAENLLNDLFPMDETKYADYGPPQRRPARLPTEESPPRQECPSCGRARSLTAKFCDGCGRKFAEEVLTSPGPVESVNCNNCGVILVRDASFCDVCGWPAESPVGQIGPKTCDGCGEELVAGANFCDACGKAAMV